MKTGEILKQKLGLSDYNSDNTLITRILTVSSKPTYMIIYNSFRKSTPTSKNNVFKFPFQAYLFSGDQLKNTNLYKTNTSPLIRLEDYNGNASNSIFVSVDISFKHLLSKKNFFNENIENNYFTIDEDYRLKELTLEQLRNKDAGNAHVDKFASDRQSIQGTEVKAGKLLDADYNITEDSLTFTWVTEATDTKEDFDKKKYKMLNPNADLNTKSYENLLIDNPSKTYDMQMKILDVSKNMKELGIEEELSKENIKILLDLSEVQLYSSSPAFQLTGINYNLSQVESAIKPTNIPLTKWAKFRGDAFLDKHLRNLLKPSSIQFYLNLMAQMAKKELKSKGVI